MEDVSIASSGELVIRATESSSKHDFDFYEGRWRIRNRKLKQRLVGSDEWEEFFADQEMSRILNGLGNTDNFVTSFDGEPFEGRSLRLFDPKTRLWSMYWTDSANPVLQPPTVGSFDGDVGRFYCWDRFDEKRILVQFKWDKSDPDNPVWSQAFSTDEGQTWEWNWFMHSSRA